MLTQAEVVVKDRKIIIWEATISCWGVTLDLGSISTWKMSLKYNSFKTDLLIWLFEQWNKTETYIDNLCWIYNSILLKTFSLNWWCWFLSVLIWINLSDVEILNIQLKKLCINLTNTLWGIF